MSVSPMELDYSDDEHRDNKSPPSKRNRSLSSDSRSAKDVPMWGKKKESPASSSVSSSASSSPRRRSTSGSPVRRRQISPPARSPAKQRKRISPPRRSPSPKRRPRRSRSPPRRSHSRSPVRRRRASPRRRSRSGSVGARRRSPSPRRSPPRRAPRQRDDSLSPKRWQRDKFSPKRDNRRRNLSHSRSRSPVDSREREKKQEDRVWGKRRESRADIQWKGEPSIWGLSPSHNDIQAAYRLFERAEEINQEQAKKGEKLKKERKKERKIEEKKKRLDDSSSDEESDSESEDEKEKKKKRKKEKKAKKDKKKKSKKAKKEKEKSKKLKPKKVDESSDEWEEREVAHGGDEGSGYSPGPVIPEHIKAREAALNSAADFTTNYGKDLLKGEGAGMAAYAARGERIPRRGEIGLSSQEIEQYEKWGYVMSGSRHKAMEATRLRKENQILTAEEKRLLSGVSHEAKKKKEEAVLDQFRSLIRNKNVRN